MHINPHCTSYLSHLERGRSFLFSHGASNFARNPLREFRPGSLSRPGTWAGIANRIRLLHPPSRVALRVYLSVQRRRQTRLAKLFEGILCHPCKASDAHRALSRPIRLLPIKRSSTRLSVLVEIPLRQWVKDANRELRVTKGAPRTESFTTAYRHASRDREVVILASRTLQASARETRDTQTH